MHLSDAELGRTTAWDVWRRSFQLYAKPSSTTMVPLADVLRNIITVKKYQPLVGQMNYLHALQ